MDRKIRIFFFPRDASRVRIITFSRRLGLAGLIALLPLCLFGFWFAFTGKLRENPERRVQRDKLVREAAALDEKTQLLQEELATLRRNLDSLESIRISVALSSGLEGQWSDDHGGGAPAARYVPPPGFARDDDFSVPLARVRDISRFLDSTLIVLEREGPMSARLPTAPPVPRGTIVTREFGPARDPFTGRKALHPGVDFGLPPGAPVHAAGGGTVTGAGRDPVWGYYVRIRHTERTETFYAHLLRPGVRAGQQVARGEVVGWTGQSGASTGPHLHFEMRLHGERVDPMPYFLSASGAI